MISSQYSHEQENKENKIQLQMIPLIAHENICNRLDSIIKRLVYIIIFLIVVLISVIAGIIYTVNQYNLVQEDKETVSIDSDLSDNNGQNIVLGGDYYGEGKAEKN